MLTPIKNIVKQANREYVETPLLRILSVSETDGRFENALASLGHTVYSNGNPLYLDPIVQLVNDHNDFDTKDLDLLIVNNHQQLEPYGLLGDSLHLPIVVMEHGIQANKQPISGMFAHVNASETVKQMMGNAGEVLHYYVDEVINPWDTRPVDVLIFGYFNQNDAGLLGILTKQFKSHKIQNGPFPTNQERKEAFANTKVFVSLSTVFSIPWNLLDAIANGCVVIGNNMPLLPEYIIDGENGFLPTNPDDMVLAIKNVLDNRSLVTKIHQNYNKMLNTTFSRDNFHKGWNRIFSAAYNKVYVRGYNANS